MIVSNAVIVTALWVLPSIKSRHDKFVGQASRGLHHEGWQKRLS